MSSSDKSTYRNIVKGTALFGGVQVFNILINLVRGKLIAVILGPAGMGISAMLTSTINIILQFAGLGLNVSAMKDISQAHAQNERTKLSETIRNFRRLVLFTAISGTIIAIIASPRLSHFAFGNSHFTLPFAVLSLFVLFSILSNGEITLLQGTGRLNDLAKTSMIGPLTGLVVSIPAYYFWRMDGIAPSMVILAAITFSVNYYFSRKIHVTTTAVSYEAIKVAATKWVSLGFVLMVSTLIGTFVTFLINAYINRYGNINDVGLFQSASSITNQYVGLVFMAMAVDYYPRLASISTDNTKVKEVVNFQSEVVMLIVTPLIILLILTAPFLIQILLSNEFLVITPLLRWMGLGLFFKAMAFPLGYIAFSKGDKKVFFWFEAIIANLFLLFFNIMAYKIYGITGMGISYCVSYMTYFFLILIVTGIKYKFKYRGQFIKLVVPLLTFCLVSFGLSLWEHLWSYVLNLGVLAITLLFTFQELNKRIDIVNLFREKFKKNSEEV